MAKKGGLNKGLGSLFAENTTEPNSPAEISIMDIEPNRDQPRKDFDQEALEELAESIKRYGLLQPLVVRPVKVSVVGAPPALPVFPPFRWS